MKRKKSIYSVALSALITVAFSCDDPLYIYQYPPSPVNISNAITFNPDLKYDTVSDIDGNIYKTITIGKHTWMAENLRVTRFRNGDTIPCIASNKNWSNSGDNNWGLCAYDNKNDSIANYGLLYGYGTIFDSRGLPPLGWHLASYSEWEEICGDKTLTYSGFDWVSSAVTDKTNINNCGLTILPSGCRVGNGTFGGRGQSFVTVSGSREYIKISEYDHFNPILWGQLWNRIDGFKIGYSVRCVKNE